mgnify:CR=1 FL=1
MPGVVSGSRAPGAGAEASTLAHPTALPRKSVQTERRAFPDQAHIATIDGIHRGRAPMVIIVGVGLLIAILAFAFIPLAMGRGARALTRWLTGRD